MNVPPTEDSVWRAEACPTKLVKYTYYGDADLNGTINGNDYNLIDAGYGSQSNPNPALRLSGWQNGDFNYDGHIDGSDYTLIDNSYNQQGASLADEVASQTAVDTSEIAELGGGTGAAVPEPGSLSLLALSAVAMLGQRRRKS